MRRLAQLQKSILLLPLLLTLALPIFLGQRAADQNPSIPAGIKYDQKRDGEKPWSIHIVKIDRAANHFKFAATVSNGEILGLSPVSEQAESLRGNGWKPLVAVNGDFFRIERGPYQGDMLGLEITSGTLISSPSGAAFWVGPDGDYRIGPVSSRIQFTWPCDDPTTSVTFTAGLNGPRTAGHAVLFTTEFGSSTRTEDNGVEVVLEPVDGGAVPRLTPATSMDLRISKIHEDGDNDIRPGKMVLSIDEELASKLPAPAKGTVLHMSARTTPDLTGVVTAIGGGPVLVHRGKINPDADQAVRHPRTAIGFNDQSFFMVVVDGRQSELSIGMTMPELAQLMLELGATEALNMDGGGSSELWLDGKIMNSPSEGHERPIANALVVLSKDL